MMAKVLALDLGTLTGWAVGNRTESLFSGYWNLKPGRFDGGGMRYLKFRGCLDEIRRAYGVTHVFFEEVRRHKGVDAAHVYGGLMGVLTSWCEEHSLPYSGLPVGEVKKNWTGKGNASKDMMVDEARARGFAIESEDQADALAIFDLAMKRLASLPAEREMADDGAAVKEAA